MLEYWQGLPTSGARAVAPFMVGGDLCLAVSQLAKDAPGTHAHLNGGEDAEFFHVGDRALLATASIRQGSGPYDLDVDSVILEWNGTTFEPFQAVPTFAARQWRHPQIGDRHFLALAQGVTMDGVTPRNPAQSMILEWDGASFRPFQAVASAWGYNWSHFRIAGHDFLAYADHRAPSIILRWDGAGFEMFQTLDGDSGRAFCFFEADGERFLAFANLMGDTLLYRWDGERFPAPGPERSWRTRVRIPELRRRILPHSGELPDRDAAGARNGAQVGDLPHVERKAGRSRCFRNLQASRLTIRRGWTRSGPAKRPCGGSGATRAQSPTSARPCSPNVPATRRNCSSRR